MRSLEIDIRLRDGPRIKMATGFTVRRTVKSIEEMIRLLWQQPAHRKLVDQLADGKRLLADVYVAYLTGQLAGIGSGNSAGNEFAEPAIDTWLAEFQASDAHRDRCRHALKFLIGSVKYRAKISELPDLLLAYRTKCLEANTPRSFNYAKQAARAFLRDTVGRRDGLYGAVADVAGMPEAKQGVSPVTVAEAKAIRDRLRALPLPTFKGKEPTAAKLWPDICAEAAATWWTMCCTGMGSTEFWGEWSVLEDRIRIVGTKRPGRRWGSLGREVPLVATATRPKMTKDRFAKILRLAGASPYQGRHSYATWLEDAEIPRTRRMLYLGHAGRDITDRYERREITQFLAEDRARLLNVLGPDVSLQLSRSLGLVVGPIAQEA